MIRTLPFLFRGDRVKKKTISEAAKLIDVSPPTLYRYIRKGDIKVVKHPLTMQLFIKDEDIQKLLEELVEFRRP